VNIHINYLSIKQRILLHIVACLYLVQHVVEVNVRYKPLHNRLKNETENLKTSVLRVGNWPVSKSELTNRYLKQFIRYLNSMDHEKLNHSNKQM
jgi:hypothetical protein